jgi:hypothetical protein
MESSLVKVKEAVDSNERTVNQPSREGLVSPNSPTGGVCLGKDETSTRPNTAVIQPIRLGLGDQVGDAIDLLAPDRDHTIRSPSIMENTRDFPPLYAPTGDPRKDRLAFFHLIEKLKVVKLFAIHQRLSFTAHLDAKTNRMGRQQSVPATWNKDLSTRLIWD